jgi:hypothetical protein
MTSLTASNNQPVKGVGKGDAEPINHLLHLMLNIAWQTTADRANNTKQTSQGVA